MDKSWGVKEGGVSQYSFNFFLSQINEKLHKGTFLLITNILVSKYFMDTRWGVKEGGVSRYSFENVLSPSTEKLRREQFCAPLISGV